MIVIIGSPFLKSLVSEILPFLLEDLEGLGCNTEINSDWVIDNNFSNEDDNPK